MPETDTTALFHNLLNLMGGKEGIALSAVTGGIGGPVVEAGKVASKLPEAVEGVKDTANLLSSLGDVTSAPFKLASAANDLGKTLGVTDKAAAAWAAVQRQYAKARIPAEHFSQLATDAQTNIGQAVRIAESAAARVQRHLGTETWNPRFERTLKLAVDSAETWAKRYGVPLNLADVRRVLMKVPK